jgi:formylglycine-generating enzyme required for sulfatase activity
VSWYDSVAFCRWLGSEMGLPETDQCYADPATLDEKQYPRDPMQTSFPKNWPLDLSKRGFRLPTESEWEVMTRSGSRTSYGFGSDAALLEHFGWYVVNSGKTSHSGRQKRPSVRGLFDVHGNLFEWTHDWYVESDFGKSNPTDPLGAETGSQRVFRGGSWQHDAGICRTAKRRVDTPSNQIRTVGLRLALCPSNPASTGAESERRQEK